jgi:hypothetical protein
VGRQRKRQRKARRRIKRPGRGAMVSCGLVGGLMDRRHGVEVDHSFCHSLGPVNIQVRFITQGCFIHHG